MKVTNGGDATARTTAKLNQQSYDEIRAQCLQTGKLFEDPFFPATMTSIGIKPDKNYEWKRPGELISDPNFVVDGINRFDVQQGELDNCWFVAAVASLSLYSEHFNRIVFRTDCLSFDKSKGYTGAFRFHFWLFGEWTEVVIDDRLPTYHGQLNFVHSSEKNEFWSSLLEKAYAKIYGSYENLGGGSASDAMEDFTGGVIEIFDFKKQKPANLFQLMQKAVTRHSLMACSVQGVESNPDGKVLNGLIAGHAYSITGLNKVTAGGRSVQLVRIRNPWGNGSEWDGPWSDGSRQWELVSKEERDSLGINFKADGEFWMSYEDFIHNFTKLEICHLGPSDDGSEKKRWECRLEKGSWKRNVTAGGCLDNKATFFINPQFRVTVIDADEDDDDDTGTLIVAVLQRRKAQHSQMLSMGYVIYQLDNPNCGPLDTNFFKQHCPAAEFPSFINRREVCDRHKLTPGHYCIIPSTFNTGEEGDFILRVFTEKPAQTEQLDEPTTIVQQVVGNTPQIDFTSDTDNELYAAFKVSAGADLEIDACELMGVLNTCFKKEIYFDSFSLDTCKSLVALHDHSNSGKLGFTEFKELWVSMRFWKKAFKQADKDNNGTLNSYELRENIRDLGFSISNTVLRSLVERFSDMDGKMYFNDYIHCIAKLSAMLKIFSSKSGDTSEAKFSMDEFLTVTMYS